MNPVIDDFTVRDFKRDVEKLCRKYKHLEEDLRRALRVLKAEPISQTRAPPDSALGKRS